MEAEVLNQLEGVWVLLMILVCEWDSWDRYLIQRLPVSARQVTLSPSDSADALLGRMFEICPNPDLVLMHINLSDPTRLPVGRVQVIEALQKRGIRVWNALTSDTTKHRIQELNESLGLPVTRAGSEGDPDELLMVKDNFNHHMWGERRLTPEERTSLGYTFSGESPIVDLPDYPVMKRADVPEQWWENEFLFFERFVTNSGGDFYRIYLAGDSFAICAGRSEKPVRRMKECRDRVDYLMQRHYFGVPELEGRLPEDLRRIFCACVKVAGALQLDFGTLDVIVDDDGAVYVVDVNPTPWWGKGLANMEFFEHLREGVEQGHLPRAQNLELGSASA